MSDMVNKSEKLASAVYLVTAFFVDQEPLKWRLRQLSTDLVSSTTVLKDKVYREAEVAVVKVRNIIDEIANLLLLAKQTGLISDTNYDILSQELTRQSDELVLPQGIMYKNGTYKIEEDFFLNSIPALRQTPSLEMETIKDKSLVPQIYKGHETIKTPSNLKEFGAISVKKNSRQSVIISILKRKKEVTIRDISPPFPNFN